MAKKESAEKAVRDIRRKTRRRFSADKKIRIVILRDRVEKNESESRNRSSVSSMDER